jgi:hypothetical protein
VTPCHGPQIVQHGVDAVERFHDRADRRHQLGALALHVAAEQRARAGTDGAETLIEERRRLLPDRDDLGEALAHEGDLLGSHASVLFRYPSRGA